MKFEKMGTPSVEGRFTVEDERAMGEFADAEAAKLAGEKTGEGGEKFKRALKNVTIGLILLAKSISGVDMWLRQGKRVI